MDSPTTANTCSRLVAADLRAMYFDLPIHDLGRRGFDVSERLHPEPYRTYVVDRNINYANWCTARCIFCDFKADPPGMNSGRKDLPDGYTLTYEQIGRKIEELVAIGGTQILMQGGLVPDVGPAPRRSATGETPAPQVGLPFEWYLNLMRFIKKNYPTIHIHAFSPPEIWAFHQLFGMSVRDVLLRLQEAGLDTVPGGGGEILADRVRRRIAQGKTLTAEWLEVMRQAHAIGMQTSCTMMLGHIETLEERFEHLRLLRDLQDESLARHNGGGFSAYICWTFQPGDTPLGRVKPLPVETSKRQNVKTKDFPPGTGHWALGTSAAAGRVSRPDAGEDACEPAKIVGSDDPTYRTHLAPRTTHRRPVNDGEHLLLADAHEYLTTLALSRVFLDNIPNVQSSWVTMGPKIGQLALFFGANDMGSVMMEENVVSAAGTTYRLNEAEIRRIITDAGWQPRKRDYYYRPID